MRRGEPHPRPRARSNSFKSLLRGDGASVDRRRARRRPAPRRLHFGKLNGATVTAATAAPVCRRGRRASTRSRRRRAQLLRAARRRRNSAPSRSSSAPPPSPAARSPPPSASADDEDDGGETAAHLSSLKAAREAGKNSPVSTCHEYMFANKRWFDASRFARANGSVDEWRHGADFHVPVFDPYRHTTIPIGAWIDSNENVPISGARAVEADWTRPTPCRLLLQPPGSTGAPPLEWLDEPCGGAARARATTRRAAAAEDDADLFSIRPLRFVTLGAGICPIDAGMLLDGLRDRTLLFMGDVVVQQLYHAYLCILAEHGARPAALGYGKGGIVRAEYDARPRAGAPSSAGVR